jgi:hypothetical protein
MHTKKTNVNRTSTHMLRCLVSVLFLTAWIILAAGCQQQQSREFDAWKWKWPIWTTKPAQSPTTQTSSAKAPSAPAPVLSNSFTIRILESTGTDLQLNEAWSYLDEAAPISGDWQMLHRNGLRCGIGQFSDWPTVRQQFEKSGTRVKTELQISLGSFAPMNILTDPMKPERTIFYYDRDGRTHGRDFGPSSMQFTITMVGRMAGGRVRTIFTPKILKPTSPLEQLAGKDNRKSMIEQELENFGIIVDLGPEEFAILGPAGGQMPASLIGSQLFSTWNQGQRRSSFILISTAQLEPEKK